MFVFPSIGLACPCGREDTFGRRAGGMALRLSSSLGPETPDSLHEFLKGISCAEGLRPNFPPDSGRKRSGNEDAAVRTIKDNPECNFGICRGTMPVGHPGSNPGTSTILLAPTERKESVQIAFDEGLHSRASPAPSLPRVAGGRRPRAPLGIMPRARPGEFAVPTCALRRARRIGGTGWLASDPLSSTA